VIWECSLLARAGRITLHRSARAFFADLFSNPAYQPLPIAADAVYDADELRFTRDPFDGLIVAAARALSLPLITRDADIVASGAVHTMW
jgi:PIN domain nuclease of toxin-antitoxin system